MIQVEINNALAEMTPDKDRLREGVLRTLASGSIEKAQIGVLIVDDAEIRRLNSKHLGHDWPTDVISFLLDAGPGEVEGEIAVSGEMARQKAAQFGWDEADELLLYVIHGTLHLVGFDDQTNEDQVAMRDMERAILASFHLTPRYDETLVSSPAAPDGGQA